MRRVATLMAVDRSVVELSSNSLCVAINITDVKINVKRVMVAL